MNEDRPKLTGALNWTEILNILTSELPIMRRNFGIVCRGLFESYARDQGRPDSDIDLLVTFEEGKEKFRLFFSCLSYLEEILGIEVELISDHALDHRITPFEEREVIWI